MGTDERVEIFNPNNDLVMSYEEKIEVYDMENNLLSLQDRDEFHAEAEKEFRETGKITKKVKSIRVLLMNSKGRVYLQRRSKYKRENPYLFDKTVGGYVRAGDTFDMTAIRECAEELGFPVAVLDNDSFEKSVISTDLNVVGIFKQIDYLTDFESTRILFNGQKIIQPYITTIYFGYYDGDIKFSDGESCGIQVYSVEDLEEEIGKKPEDFTEDLKFIISSYKNYIKGVKKRER